MTDTPETNNPASAASTPVAPTSGDLPPGDHPLEVAARAGIGPLSTLGKTVWHGEAVPCVSCGQLVRRNSANCPSCGQDLSDEMIARMRNHAGPWYVLEHLRPFPGVALDRILLQVRRGLITPVSIVRGPSTDYQWRFAVETPGLCRLFGRCWNCYHGVKDTTEYCPACLSHLGFEKPSNKPAAVQTQNAAPPSGVPSAAAPTARSARSFNAQAQAAPAQAPTATPPPGELARLASAARLAHRNDAVPTDHGSSSRGIWIGVVAVLIVIAGLIWFSSARSTETAKQGLPSAQSLQAAPSE